jgi:2'-hydroxyisoflavone reductase
VSAWTDLPVWVPGQGDSSGFARRSIDRAVQAGLTFRPLATTSVDTLAWFRQQPEARQAKPKTGLTPAREAEVLSAWKASAKKPG